ncbi:hypothetical protein B0H19DRAFT_1110733 [Mycena capillaripes]|nr:hypothetical protein B0H19DRAFT_1110733 [Mycena capillaripes]
MVIAASHNHSPLADPESPLSFLPSELAAELKILRFIWIGTTAVFFWDILDNFGADTVLLFRSRIRWPGSHTSLPGKWETLSHTHDSCVAQVLSPCVLVGWTTFLTFPVGGCQELDRVLIILYPIVISSTSLLFFYRLRAIYAGSAGSRTVTVLFSLVWLAELVACIGVIFGTEATNIGPTRYCLLSQLAPHSAAACITQAILDTGVFVAISYRLTSNAYVDHGWRVKFCVFFRGDYLPYFSRAMLVDGQMYYMITVVTNITASVIIYAPGISPTYRSLASLPNLMLSTLMACRVFRHTKIVFSRNNFPSFDDVGAAVDNDNTRSLHFVHSAPQRTDDDSVLTDAVRASELRAEDGRKSGRGQNGWDFTNLTIEAGVENGLERVLV